MVRAQGRCERCGRRGVLDPDHARDAGDGGADTWSNLSLLCRSKCHRLKSEAFARGRLIVTVLGEGRFEYVLIRAAHKAAYRRGDYRIIEGPTIGGRLPTIAERADLQAMSAE